MKIELSTQIQLDGMLFSLAVNNDHIYTGGSSKKLLRFNSDLTGQKLLVEHKKSIRCIATKGDILICGSYDGDATLFHRHEVYEKIEGPETEIKGVDFLSGNLDNNEIALCSRGKTCWVLKLDKKVEVESILEDHTQDVKGIKFHDEHLYSFGYDNTIKVYQKFTSYDDSWVISQSIEQMTDTVWDILILDKLYVACNDGSVYIFKKDKIWTFEVEKKISSFPIYTICSIHDKIAMNIDRQNIVIFDKNLDVVCAYDNAHNAEINSIRFMEKKNLLISCSDDGVLATFNIIEN